MALKKAADESGHVVCGGAVYKGKSFYLKVSFAGSFHHCNINYFINSTCKQLSADVCTRYVRSNRTYIPSTSCMFAGARKLARRYRLVCECVSCACVTF